MKTSTQLALLAYVQALRDEGIRHAHVGELIPMHHPLTRIEQRKLGMPTWTQFVTFTVPMPEGVTYDRMSGWFHMEPLQVQGPLQNADVQNPLMW